jgi:hypothetical protein
MKMPHPWKGIIGYNIYFEILEPLIIFENLLPLK